MNPYVGITFIADNPNMETPPRWFLQQLHDYDADLVLFPSIARPFAYVVARRRRHSAWTAAERATITNPDTQRCMQYGLIPVCMMFKHGPVWNADTILARLRARDVWRHGGADAVADLLEAQEAQEQVDRDTAKRDELWHLSGDAYRSYQARTGQRVSNPGPSRLGAANPTSSSGSIPTGAGKILLA